MAVDKSDKNNASPKRKSKKGIILGVIVVAIVAIGVGLFAWHNTPGFCGTMCHDTMNEHLANFEGTDASKGAGLAHVHQAANLGCLDCHEADLETQVSELRIQLFDNPGNVELASKYYIDNEKCLSCHGKTYNGLSALTAALADYNPHDNPHGQMNCNECHKGHASQIDMCGECHVNGGQEMKA